jgi:hypothetical protein
MLNISICDVKIRVLFVSLGVRGKPRVYCSLLAYCTDVKSGYKVHIESI